MIDELKALLEAVQHIPQLAVAVAFGFLLYKLFVWGSVVAAVVKCGTMLAQCVKQYITAQQAICMAPTEFTVSGICIDEAVRLSLLTQIARLKRGGLTRIHDVDVDWLRAAIDQRGK